MENPFEKRFGPLSLPLGSLRTYYEFSNNQFSLSAELQEREEIEKDLLAALAAGRRGDANWLKGQQIVDEVQDKNSIFYGRSAFQIFYRAAAFEAILSKIHHNTVLCPNLDIQNLAVPIKHLRDYRFLNSNEDKPLSLFPETVEKREGFAQNIEEGLRRGRDDVDADTLSGWEVLKQFGTTCADTKALDIFWQTAVANAVLEPNPMVVKTVYGQFPIVPLVRAQTGLVTAKSSEEFSKSAASPQTGPSVDNNWNSSAALLYGLTSPFNMPETAMPLFGGYGTNSYVNPTLGTTPPGMQMPGLLGSPIISPFGYGTEDMSQVLVDTVNGTVNISAIGGGSFLARAPVAEYQMTFRNVAEAGHPAVAQLVKADRIALPPKPGAQTVPYTPAQIIANKTRMVARAKGHAEILFDRPGAPQEMIRTDVERGLKGAGFSPRRILGGLGILYGITNLGLQIFRRDGKGLDGAMSDVGAEPVGAKLANIAIGGGVLAGAVLVTGLTAPAAAVLAVIATGVVIDDLYDTLYEAHTQADEDLKRELQFLRQSPHPPHPSNGQTPKPVKRNPPMVPMV